MICRIDNFTFTAKNIDEIEESLELRFGKVDRINNNPKYQDLNKFEESITIKGEIIKESIHKLEPLKDIAKAKKSVRFTTIKGSFMVLITSIKVSKKTFLRGAELIKEFTIELKRDYGWNLF